MTIITERPTPGIRFETVPPGLDETLPRMDIAAFVGLASSGPLDVPVVVEDADRFREVFGDDVPLAIDPTTGRMATAHLGRAVEGFFANGGRRCWVVRVAGQTHTNVFPVPGVLAIPVSDDPSTWRLATAEARSPGSWSDGIRCGARVTRTLSLRSSQFAAVDVDAGTLTLTTRSDVPMVGDGLLLRFSGGTSLHVQVATVTMDSGTAQPVVTWIPEEGRWTSSAMSPLDDVAADRMSILGVDGQVELPDPRVTITGGGDITVTTSSGLTDAPKLGDTVAVSMPEGTFVGVVTQPPTITEPGSELGLFPVVQVLHAPPAAPGPVERLDTVGIELATWRDDTITGTSGDLETYSGTPRWWGHLPNDVDLFSRELLAGLQAINRSTRRRIGPLDSSVLDPRFDLAAPVSAPPAVFPIGILPGHDSKITAGPGEPGADRMVRNGLVDFRPQMFVDASLVGHGTRSLISEGKRRLRADARMSLLLDKDERASSSRRLRGFHAVLPIEEVTLLSIPDAVQPGWSQTTVEPPQILEAPVLRVAPPGDAVTWSHSGEVTGYELQAALDQTFEVDERSWPVRAEERTHDLGGLTHGRHFVRIRALDNDLTSPWSNTVDLRIPPVEFEVCTDPMSAPPILTLAGSEVSWCVPDADGECLDDEDPGLSGAEYRLQVADDPSFLHPSEALKGPETTYTASMPEVGAVYYRVQVTLPGKAASPWSNTIVIPAGGGLVWRMSSSEGVDVCCVALQQALLRFCSARADLLGLLSVPNRYRPQDIAEHLHLLRNREVPLVMETGGDCAPTGMINEAYVTTYGAVHHPWMTRRRDTAGDLELVPTPPDGAVAGALAARSIERGPWTAPANIDVVGGVGVDPARLDPDWLRVIGANPLVAQRGRVRVDGADTLAHTEVLRPIGARRLMMLIRRIALRDGTRYVFEPNGDDFRRLVVMRVEAILADLFRRGAFAGNTVDEAYRVVVQRTLDDVRAVDRGQLIVDILVAPAMPLEFITVRLLQVGTSGFRIEEVA